MDFRHLFGSAGECSAADYLKKKKYKILGQNFNCRYGELDIIAQHGRYVVFVEVKTRKNENYALAREFVTRAKQERVMKAAMLWLQQNDVDLQPRFDVIEVVGEGKMQKITHIEDAFS